MIFISPIVQQVVFSFGKLFRLRLTSYRTRRTTRSASGSRTWRLLV